MIFAMTARRRVSCALHAQSKLCVESSSGLPVHLTQQVVKRPKAGRPQPFEQRVILGGEEGGDDMRAVVLVAGRAF